MGRSIFRIYSILKGSKIRLLFCSFYGSRVFYCRLVLVVAFFLFFWLGSWFVISFCYYYWSVVIERLYHPIYFVIVFVVVLIIFLVMITVAS